MSPEAEALREKLDHLTYQGCHVPSAIRVGAIARTIVEELGITEETVDECLCGAGYALGRCKHCDRRIDVLSTLLELANHGE